MNFGLSPRSSLIDPLKIDFCFCVTGPSLTVPAATSLCRRRSAPAELTRALVAIDPRGNTRPLLVGTCCQGLESRAPSSCVVTSMIWVLSIEPIGGTDSPRVLRSLDASLFAFWSLYGVSVRVEDTASTDESDAMDPADCPRASAWNAPDEVLGVPLRCGGLPLVAVDEAPMGRVVAGPPLAVPALEVPTVAVPCAASDASAGPPLAVPIGAAADTPWPGVNDFASALRGGPDGLRSLPGLGGVGGRLPWLLARAVCDAAAAAAAAAAREPVDPS